MACRKARHISCPGSKITMSSSNAAVERDRESALWSQLPGSDSDENYCASWLSLQCATIGDVSAGLLLLGAADYGPYQPAAHWPRARITTSSFRNRHTSAARTLRAYHSTHGSDRCPVVRCSSGMKWHIRLLVADRLYGVVVLKVSSRPQAQLESVLQQLSWGSAWLEVLIHRQNGIENSTENERLRTGARSACNSRGARRIRRSRDCVCNGFGGAIVLRTGYLGFQRWPSHSCESDILQRAVRYASQPYPCHRSSYGRDLAPGNPHRFSRGCSASLQLMRDHQELARHHGAGAICSVPLGREGQIYGVLTFERLADNPFSPQRFICAKRLPR